MIPTSLLLSALHSKLLLATHRRVYLLERGEGAVGRVHVLLVHLIGEQQQVPVHTEANHVLLVLQGENLLRPTGGNREGGRCVRQTWRARSMCCGGDYAIATSSRLQTTSCWERTCSETRWVGKKGIPPMRSSTLLRQCVRPFPHLNDLNVPHFEVLETSSLICPYPIGMPESMTLWAVTGCL